MLQTLKDTATKMIYQRHHCAYAPEVYLSSTDISTFMWMILSVEKTDKTIKCSSKPYNNHKEPNVTYKRKWNRSLSIVNQWLTKTKEEQIARKESPKCQHKVLTYSPSAKYHFTMSYVSKYYTVFFKYNFSQQLFYNKV